MGNLDPASYPSSFFIFVNQASPVTYNNFNRTGQFCSAGFTAAKDSQDALARYKAGTLDMLPFERNQNLSGGFMSPFQVNVITHYRLEYDAEVARRHHAPEAPCRLSAVLAFGRHG
jgi:hypothetical protein